MTTISGQGIPRLCRIFTIIPHSGRCAAPNRYMATRLLQKPCSLFCFNTSRARSPSTWFLGLKYMLHIMQTMSAKVPAKTEVILRNCKQPPKQQGIKWNRHRASWETCELFSCWSVLLFQQFQESNAMQFTAVEVWELTLKYSARFPLYKSSYFQDRRELSLQSFVVLSVEFGSLIRSILPWCFDCILFSRAVPF